LTQTIGNATELLPFTDSRAPEVAEEKESNSRKSFGNINATDSINSMAVLGDKMSNLNPDDMVQRQVSGQRRVRVRVRVMVKVMVTNVTRVRVSD
jgi:hypothetical protein